MIEETESLVAFAGFGSATVCCLALEVLGGAALLGGVTTAVGLSAGMTYLLIVGLSGVLAALLAVGYRQFGGENDVVLA
jgi:hypothetical protein